MKRIGSNILPVQLDGVRLWQRSMVRFPGSSHNENANGRRLAEQLLALIRDEQKGFDVEAMVSLQPASVCWSPY